MAYQRLWTVKKHLRTTPFVALTATLTPLSLKLCVETLNLDDPIQILLNNSRPNIRLNPPVCSL